MHEFTGGEFIIMGLPGDSLDPETTSLIKDVQPSGFILFARNIKAPQQLRALTDQLRTLVKHEPIITIDQEGGRVSRLKEFMSEPPSASQLSVCGDVALVDIHGRLTGRLLRLFGFNVNLAPVLDVELDPGADNSLKGRSYGSTPEQVIANARAFAEAMTAQQILSCGKHFPGYSAATVDPHHDLPTVHRTIEEMLQLEWLPFQQLAASVDLMMVGHVRYPLIDPANLPATLSPHMVQHVLRKQLGFAGCTITDDMDMGAMKSHYDPRESAALSLQSGNDLILICHNIAGVRDIAAALKKVPDEAKVQAYERILAVRRRLAAPTAFSMQDLQSLDESVKRLREATLKPLSHVISEARHS